MREIKFRAWYRKGKEMYYTDKNQIQMIFGRIVMPFDVKQSNINWHHNAFDWMQYTGLKDKNGKEIYEGDLIDVTHFDYAEGRGKVKTGKSMCEVIYEEGMAGYLPFVDGSCPIDIDSDFGDWEVIGNIWENGELLK